MDIVIVSEQDFPNMVDQAKNWSLSMSTIPVVTLGAKGAIAFKHGEGSFTTSHSSLLK